MTAPQERRVVNVCAPASFPIRRILRCPTCERRRRFAGRDALWYGPTMTCLGCGDSWSDGERLPRPFRPRWRPQAIAAARQVWDEAGRYTRAEHWEWLRAQRQGPDDGG